MVDGAGRAKGGEDDAGGVAAATVLLRQGRADEAIALLEAGRQVRNGDPEARFVLADAFFQARRWSESLALTEALLSEGCRVAYNATRSRSPTRACRKPVPISTSSTC